MNLNIIPNGAIKRVHVSQNDVGRTLTFNLFNDSLAYAVPSGATVKIQGTKPSGFGFSETCTVSGNVATIDTTEAMTDESGNIQTELSISYDDVVIGTSNFILAVERNPHPSNTTDGTQITAQSLQVQIDELRDEIESGGSGLTDDIKQALLNCFAHVAWIDEHGQDYYDALEDALYPPATLTSISAVYTQSGTVYDTDSLDVLKDDLVVTAHYDDSSTRTVTSYTLSGTLTEGTSTITVSYGGKTTTFTVTVSEVQVTYLYNWDFTQSLVDSVNNAQAEVTSDLSISSSGLNLSTKNSAILLPQGTYGLNRRIEVDFGTGGTWGANEANHGAIIGVTPSNIDTSPPSNTLLQGLFWRNGTNYNKFFMYCKNAWYDKISADYATTKDFLDGKTMFMESDASGHITVGFIDETTNNDVVVGQLTDVVYTTETGTRVIVGRDANNNQGMSGMIVRALRIREVI